MKFVIVFGSANKSGEPAGKVGEPRYKHHFEALYELRPTVEIRKDLRDFYGYSELIIESMTILSQEDALILSPKTCQRILDRLEKSGNLDGFVEIKE